MFAEDLGLFFEDFGIEVTFSRAGDPVATTTLIRDAPMSETNVYDRSFYDEKFYEATVQGSDVTLLGIEDHLADVRIGDVATVNTVNWFVASKEPDGTGLATIRLSLNSI